MSGTSTGAPAEQQTSSPRPGERTSALRVLRDQRKAIGVALGLAVASFWVLGQLDRWGLAVCVATGVLLGLVNHLATELWLLRIITSGAQPTRAMMTTATIARLAVLSVVAVGITVWFWPDGIGLLLGLAVFRLIALMMTSVTLLRELREQA